jgi:peptide/nickel transport system ATP-binding protein
MTAPLLEVEGLRMHFFTRGGVVKAVDDVSFSLERGRVMGLVGESGSGKSMTGYSIMGLVDAPGRIVSGRIALNGRELTRLDAASWRKLRGDRIAMIFQDPMMTLNPVLRIDTQMVEAVLAHRSRSRAAALARCREALVREGIASPDERLAAYPHQFSGGMRQRVAIAIALVNEPDIVIADEPTTALDVTIQGQILFEMQRLCRETGTGLIWITHDLSVVAGLADDVCVMYAGRIVESGPVDQVLERPMHPYTAGLLESIPSRNEPGRPLRQIPGMAPSLAALGEACAFRERCNRVSTACASAPATRVVAAGRSIRCCNPLA